MADMIGFPGKKGRKGVRRGESTRTNNSERCDENDAPRASLLNNLHNLSFVSVINDPHSTVVHLAIPLLLQTISAASHLAQRG
jgi:hypothetical protein